MQKIFKVSAIIKKGLFITLMVIFFSCKKDISKEEQSLLTQQKISSASKTDKPNYNLEVKLNGDGNRSGHIHFRQDKDPAKIITLDTKVHHLEPTTEYLLQRAVDVNLDGNCTGTNWLTLGHGLQPQSILTDHKGNGNEELWRDVSAIPSGTTFDIHFRVINKLTLAVVLTSDCYQYTVR